jgi:hypothetical protein
MARGAWGVRSTRIWCSGTVGEPRPRPETTEAGIHAKVEPAPRTQPKPHQDASTHVHVTSALPIIVGDMRRPGAKRRAR